MRRDTRDYVRHLVRAIRGAERRGLFGYARNLREELTDHYAHRVHVERRAPHPLLILSPTLYDSLRQPVPLGANIRRKV